MGFFKKCMFSAVEGTVLSDGKPVEGALVKRVYLWGDNDEKKDDYTQTDAKGKFSMPAIYSNSLSVSLLPLHEPEVIQDISIEYRGKEYFAWSFTKVNYELGGEQEMNPLRLTCDLSWEYENHNAEDPLKNFGGICKVDS